MTTRDILIRPDGSIEFIRDDILEPLARRLSNVEIRRASHVEPTDELSDRCLTWLAEHYLQTPGLPATEVRPLLPRSVWWADMLPSCGPILGPFDTHKEAIDAEIQWITDHRLCSSEE